MADVIFGGLVRYMFMVKTLETKPALVSYVERLAARPALKRADDAMPPWRKNTGSIAEMRAHLRKSAITSVSSANKAPNSPQNKVSGSRASKGQGRGCSIKQSSELSQSLM